MRSFVTVQEPRRDASEVGGHPAIAAVVIWQATAIPSFGGAIARSRYCAMIRRYDVRPRRTGHNSPAAVGASGRRRATEPGVPPRRTRSSVLGCFDFASVRNSRPSSRSQGEEAPAVDRGTPGESAAAVAFDRSVTEGAPFTGRDRLTLAGVCLRDLALHRSASAGVCRPYLRE